MPSEPAPQTTRPLGFQVIAPLRDFLRTSAASGVVLVVATLVALSWANSPWASSYRSLWERTAGVNVGGWTLSLSLHDWVNDGLMALFFSSLALKSNASWLMAN